MNLPREGWTPKRVIRSRLCDAILGPVTNSTAVEDWMGIDGSIDLCEE
jgi:hypothetical protein